MKASGPEAKTLPPGHHCPYNPLTTSPAVIGHATSILVGRISAGCFSERRKKEVARVVIKGSRGGEIEIKGQPFKSSITRSSKGGGRIN
ncbi:hypothetical protein AVEN_225644-1 [Araneus ventricosus]|uniref:Uncharacterized protein n=1 Tax=Araneus ventricosus TaxID=182803 RepID=A0A4Y2EM68_ARAVE|nr:hypothetical protein AVEN_225644-1 [Araneus ventricosus]